MEIRNTANISTITTYLYKTLAYIKQSVDLYELKG